MSRTPCGADALDILARLDQIAVALSWLEQLAERDGWPSRVTFGLTLSADEALTNIVTHAFGAEGSADRRLHLSCSSLSDRIVLRIEDDGQAFDPTTAVPDAVAESVEEAGVGGHGLRLMQHYLQALDYTREQDKNVLTLVASRT
jgi:serine/threonine-protein kinase RsbW